MSWQLWALDAWLRLREKPRLAREPSVEVARAHMEATATRAFPVEPGVWQEARLRADPPLAAWRLPAPEGAGVLLWLHGGAYCLGSPRTHAGMVAALARRAGTGAVLPDYRLAPEAPFPAAVEDALAAWEALRTEGWPAGRIALGGDSAGGGLAFALLHLLLAAGAPPPGCVVAFSPWTDLTLSGASLSRLARRDAFLPVARMNEIRDLYLAGADPCDPRASPHLGRFAGAPPVLIQASRAEILLDDARLMAGRLEMDGAAVTLDLVSGAPHVWQAYHGWLPEAAAAL
ncbi:MAG TPA: alpha/beta hydrolase, partial [Amaricoccus sp.]|nr:alpha/beta hydrolase [Amaricoccus sp.]